MIFLKENTHETTNTDPLAEALANLIKVANESNRELSPEMLNEMVQYQALSEAGGFISYIKRWFTGSDMTAVDEIRKELATLTTASNKVELLRFIDTLIEDAKKAAKTNISSPIFLALTTGAGIAAYRNAERLKGFTARKSRRDSGNPIPMEPTVFDQEGNAVETSAIGLAMQLISRFKFGIGLIVAVNGVLLIRSIWQAISAANGTLGDYIDALYDLRKEVESKRV